MGSPNATYKVHNSELNSPTEKTESKFKIKLREITSMIRPSRLSSRNKTFEKGESVSLKPRTWMDDWKDNAPVISASEEFYGLPEAIILLLWTYVIESDGGKQNHYMEPSLVENIYHYDHSQQTWTGRFKINMTGARILLRVNSFSRSLAARKLSGTLPIFNAQGVGNGILRFDPKIDIIHIQRFHLLAVQMTPTVGKGKMLHIEYENFGRDTAEELLAFYPDHPGVRRLMRREAKHNFPFKRSLDIRLAWFSDRLYTISDKLYTKHEFPSLIWDQSRSIQNLVIDYYSLCKSILIIHQLMRQVHVHTSYGAMPRFTGKRGPMSTFYKFLREVGNVKNLCVGDDEWHDLSAKDGEWHDISVLGQTS
ncbi:hypothetical protein EAE96_006956 [Botrytis aclada]|nr:hypothetical protein EAE96_006956 [Botrytis aclada]